MSDAPPLLESKEQGILQKISPGNVITLAVMLIAFISTWATLNRDMDNMRRDFASYKQRLDSDFVRKDVDAVRDRALMDQVTLMRKQLERIEEKVDRPGR